MWKKEIIMNHNKSKFWLHFPGRTAKKAVMCKLARKMPEPFEFNIRQTTMSPTMGLMAVEFTGPIRSINRAIRFLERTGVRVEPIEGDVIE